MSVPIKTITRAPRALRKNKMIRGISPSISLKSFALFALRDIRVRERKSLSYIVEFSNRETWEKVGITVTRNYSDRGHEVLILD